MLPTDCGSPPSVIDGTVNYVTTTYASAAVYTCDDGYTLTGDSVIVCDASGLWDPPAPTCKIGKLTDMHLLSDTLSFEFKTY